MAPVSGSRSTSISSRSADVGWGFEETMLRALAVLSAAMSARADEGLLLASSVAMVFSVPPVAWLRRAVRPRRR